MLRSGVVRITPAPDRAPLPTLANGRTDGVTGAGTLDLRGRSGIAGRKGNPRALANIVYLPLPAAVHLSVTSAAGHGSAGTVVFGAPGLRATGLTITTAPAAGRHRSTSSRRTMQWYFGSTSWSRQRGGRWADTFLT